VDEETPMNDLRSRREPCTPTPATTSAADPEPIGDWRVIDAWPALSCLVDLALADSPRSSPAGVTVGASR
jgi:hypothetical protein